MRLIITIIILIPTMLSAQMLLNPRGKVLEDLPFFNPEFIRSQKIKSFKGNYATKFNDDIIRPNNDVYEYKFDRLGQLVKKFKIHFKDTLVSTYQYDYKGNVTLHREKNKYGFYEYRYKYDNRNRVIAMEMRRDKKSTYNKFSFELDESTIVAKESYEYIKLEGIDYKKICYNQSGRIYKIEFYYFNEDGLLSKKESALHNGKNRIEENYFYNEDQKVTEVKTLFISSGNKPNRKVFTYDEEGNVLSKFVYRGDQLLSEEQLVYNKNNKALKAILSRENNEAKITILQFKHYMFY